MSIKIYRKYHTKNACYKAAQKITPVGVLVHSTGAVNPYLKRYVDYPEVCGVNKYGNHWNREYPDGRSVCVHGFVGLDKNDNAAAVQILPYNIACWGCGSGRKGSYNFGPAYIQFEICEGDHDNDGLGLYLYNAAVDYAAAICKEYGFTADNITSHVEAHAAGYASNHGDPMNWFPKFGKSMDTFRADVAAKLKAGNPDTGEEPEDYTLYRVQVGAFKVKANAEATLAKAKAAGFSDAFIQAGDLYRVQVGAFRVKDNATAYLNKAKSAGFTDAFIATVVKQ